MLAWHLGLRYLRKRRAAWLALAAVTLSVAVPVIVLGVMQGIVDLTKRQVRAFESDLTVLAPPSVYALYNNNQKRLGALENDDDIANYSAFIEGVAFINNRSSGSRRDGDANFFTKIEGTDFAANWRMQRLTEHNLHARPGLDLNAQALAPDERGSGFLTPLWRHKTVFAGMHIAQAMGGMALPLPPQKRPLPGVILGREMIYESFTRKSRRFQLWPGERISIIIPNGTGGVVGRVVAEVSDTIGTGAIEIDRYQTMLPLPQAQILADMDGKNPADKAPSVSGYRVQLHDGDKGMEVKQRLRSEHGLYAETWQMRRGNLVRSFEVQRNIMLLVMVCIQCICIFIIYAVFSTLVAEKRHDIGVLLGLGARARSINGAFLLAGQIACLLGGILGWLIGWGVLAGLNPFGELTGIVLLPQNVFYAPQAPISWDWRLPAFFLGVIMLVGLLATWLPARRAGRIDPIATLRENG